MDTTVLRMRGITKVFTGVRALDNVQLEIKQGEVHALMGENGAGKSTLMKVLLGIYHPDAGTIEYNGEQVRFRNPSDALNSGISMIHQEMSLVADMDVAENIWLGRESEFLSFGLINKRKRYERTRRLLKELGVDLNPKAKIKSLNVAMMQLTEIVRAVSYNAKIIIMDEPTSALTDKEINTLYQIIRDLTKKGTAIIFTSHKLEEVFEICDNVTVLRDGQYIATKKCSEITERDMIKLIVGRDESALYQKNAAANIGETVLEVKNLRTDYPLQDISFALKRGEILGFSGLMGAGRSEVMRAIFGIDKMDSGTILLNHEIVTIRSPKQAVRRGFAMITEDRLRMGAIYTLSVLHNATLSSLKRVAGALTWLNPGREKQLFAGISEKIHIKYSSENELISKLSGGNQQKVLLARCLLTNPKILIMDEPTRGIDVGAKMEIYKLIEDLAGQGVAILLVSSELPELLSLCDRIIVMRQGSVVYENTRAESTQEKLISYAFGTNA